ncbi:MAG TPA: LL-diaminopimelate aminotransferase [Spirochaetia bacterium]|nr:LL-diaminopimelate aminotransferase [Spirochaetia bacterium]
MIRINANYRKLASSYLFVEVARRVAEYTKEHPHTDIIKLGIGDVTEPLPPACIAAFRAGVEELADRSSFKGYGPEQGYEFLRNAIAENDFKKRGAEISADEIFVSDGAKCDTGNIQELFATDISIAIPDPVYTVYVDTNVMAGRTGEFSEGRYEGLVYLDATAENSFVPSPPPFPVDLIYLCFPNNPTGATATKTQLESWVTYARRHKALILFDAAYEEFIREPSLPHSIFEIEGARDVAIEFRSFSKTAGFTGVRCAYTVIPKSCMGYDASGRPFSLHDMWDRRQSTKFNGVSYPVQRAAHAVYSEEGKKQIRGLSNFYLENAAIIRTSLSRLGFSVSGGENSPYLWVNIGMDSWDFFDRLLTDANVVCTPGSGFGRCGNGYVRISAFNSRENVEKALLRIERAFN